MTTCIVLNNNQVFYVEGPQVPIVDRINAERDGRGLLIAFTQHDGRRVWICPDAVDSVTESV